MIREFMFKWAACAAAVAVVASPRPLLAQGCVATGQSSMMNEACHLALGEGGSARGPYLRKNQRQVSLGYRYFRSHRHFVGATEQVERQEEGSEVINRTNSLDLALTWALTDRTQLTLGIPHVNNSRTSRVVLTGGGVDRAATHSAGLGDVRLVATRWMKDPETNPEGNFALGLGAKFPTGRYNAKDDFLQANGTTRNREVDQSIQPGDGGTGVIFQFQAFKQDSPRTTFYAAGLYLANPRGNNGVSTNRSRATESVMSVADQFSATAGVGHLVWAKTGLALSVGARIEGVPVRDLFGPDADFRRPGYTVSIEPGVSVQLGSTTLGVNVPWAVHRERTKSMPDRSVGGRHGDAAFADYAILVSASQRF